MQIGILGTGEVGRTLATGFAGAGHDVMIAGRTKAKAAERTREVKTAALKTGTFADAAAFAELVVLSVSGSVAVDVLRSVSRQVSGKVVPDARMIKALNMMTSRVMIDLGDITAARGMESWMHLWLKLWGSLGTARFNIGIVR